MKVKNIIKWLIPIIFLSCFTSVITTTPETLEEFAMGALFGFLFWGSMFVGALVDDSE